MILLSFLCCVLVIPSPSENVFLQEETQNETEIEIGDWWEPMIHVGQYAKTTAPTILSSHDVDQSKNLGYSSTTGKYYFCDVSGLAIFAQLQLKSFDTITGAITTEYADAVNPEDTRDGINAMGCRVFGNVAYISINFKKFGGGSDITTTQHLTLAAGVWGLTERFSDAMEQEWTDAVDVFKVCAY